VNTLFNERFAMKSFLRIALMMVPLFLTPVLSIAADRACCCCDEQVCCDDSCTDCCCT
jgi:hypothetical protein